LFVFIKIKKTTLLVQVLFLSHPRKRIRDTSRFKKFRQLTGGKTPSLKKLSEKVLGVRVQEGEHNSVSDCDENNTVDEKHIVKQDSCLF